MCLLKSVHQDTQKQALHYIIRLPVRRQFVTTQQPFAPPSPTSAACDTFRLGGLAMNRRNPAVANSPVEIIHNVIGSSPASRRNP